MRRIDPARDAGAFAVPAVLFSAVVVPSVSVVVNAVFPAAGMLAAVAIAVPSAVIVAFAIAVLPFARGQADWSETVENDQRQSFETEFYTGWRPGWVFPAAARVNAALKLMAPSFAIRLVVIPKIYRWVFNDSWVVAWLLYAVLAFAAIASLHGPARALGVVMVVFGAFRLFEIVSYHVDFVFFTALSRIDKVSKTQRTAVLTVANYLEVVLWFASSSMLLAQYGSLTTDGPTPIVLLQQSLVEMVGNSDGAVHLHSTTAWIVSLSHKAIGLFMTLIVLTRVMAMLRPPDSLDEERTTTRSEHRSGSGPDAR